MTLSLTLACLWVVTAAVVAMLPMRYQYAPGIALLVAAVPLLVFLGREHNPWIVLAVLAAIISMFRRPLRVLVRHLRARL
ncbi:DUF2484 family protein [Actibacterium sp. XHP0104]|uniref:DUF2484 family protein n=1 Tax=Actibacterium sp. XHP0104 TaxID=2984335 RepID=UPI0021E97989|nr:DUF2484 family protein [Actibacterium sp. XHP0104]MCV2881332.1 DUF2484 family protein [Actibacterium sp. XHP0104]